MKLPNILMLAGALLLLGAQDAAAKFVPEAHPMSLTNKPPHVKWSTIAVPPIKSAGNIHFYNKLNPVWWLKNNDDPQPPAWFRPGEKHRQWKWFWRNPFHNFDFYIIGVADKKFSRSGRFPDQNANPRGGWDFEVSRYKFIYLPFITYHRPKLAFYFGWRTHGNFGVKINANPDKSPGPKAVPAPVPADNVTIKTNSPDKN